MWSSVLALSATNAEMALFSTLGILVGVLITYFGGISTLKAKVAECATKIDSLEHQRKEDGDRVQCLYDKLDELKGMVYRANGASHKTEG